MIQTEQELREKLEALGDLDENTRNSVVCSLIGHSKIQSSFWGYFNCGRCRAQVGDSLGGAYRAENVVIIGHGCSTCRANFEALSWRDKIFVPDPFAEVDQPEPQHSEENED